MPLLNEDTDEPNGLIDVGILASNIKACRCGSNASVFISLLDDDPTVVSLARTGSNGSIEEGKNVAFTVTLGRALVSVPNKIIDVPLIVSDTNITTADWSLARKSSNSLKTG
ncbi:MAG: hypothetical protein OXH57_11255, partial [Ekhidna sp.]|nr:hypothetical protein [Ekhidna sp.]